MSPRIRDANLAKRGIANSEEAQLAAIQKRGQELLKRYKQELSSRNSNDNTSSADTVISKMETAFRDREQDYDPMEFITEREAEVLPEESDEDDADRKIKLTFRAQVHGPDHDEQMAIDVHHEVKTCQSNDSADRNNRENDDRRLHENYANASERIDNYISRRFSTTSEKQFGGDFDSSHDLNAAVRDIGAEESGDGQHAFSMHRTDMRLSPRQSVTDEAVERDLGLNALNISEDRGDGRLAVDRTGFRMATKIRVLETDSKMNSDQVGRDMRELNGDKKCSFDEYCTTTPLSTYKEKLIPDVTLSEFECEEEAAGPSLDLKDITLKEPLEGQHLIGDKSDHDITRLLELCHAPHSASSYKRRNSGEGGGLEEKTVKRRGNAKKELVCL
jgi:hypothetical protein